MNDLAYYEDWLRMHSLNKGWQSKHRLLAERLVAVLARARELEDEELAALLDQLDDAC